MAKINLALISPNENSYSETFIQFHREKINANIKYLYNGLLPEISEDKELVIHYNFLNKVKRKIDKLLFNEKINFHEKAIINYFQRHNIQVILAEFGMTGVAMMKICKVMNIPLIVHFHGVDAYKKEIIDQYKLAYLELFKEAKKIVVVSKHMFQQLQKLGCPLEKLILNPYGPSDLFFEISNNYNSTSFLSVGRFVEKKAPQNTIKAFHIAVKRFPHAYLRMVGNGPLLKVCKKLVCELNLSANVEFMDVLPRKKIIELYSQSIGFVQHSVKAQDGDSEGTPVAVLEASAGGLAVIATRHAGIPDVIAEGITGLLNDEHDIEGMADHMNKILSNQGLAAKMGKNGRDRIKKEFTLEKHIAILNDIICKAAQKI